MTVCDEWTRQKRRGVNVRHCTTEASENRGEKDRMNKAARDKKKEDMGVFGSVILCECICLDARWRGSGKGTVGYLHMNCIQTQLHALWPSVYVQLVKHAECARVYTCVCLLCCAHASTCVRACVCKAELG